MFTSNDFVLGLLVYEGLLIAALAGSLVYLSVTFYRFKDKTEAALAELSQQGKDTYTRVAQMQAILAIMDTFGITLLPPSSSSTSSASSKATLSKPERISKNPHRWDVLSNQKDLSKEIEQDPKKDV